MVITIRNHGNIGRHMNTSELLSSIKSEVAEAALSQTKDAVNMYLVVKHADQLKDINPLEFARSIGRKASYATEFRKGLNLAKIINERGL